MAIALTRAQRDAVRQEIVTELTALGDLAGFIDSGDFAKAREYRDRFADELHLLDDLGWEEEDPRNSFELTLPTDRLDRTFRRLREGATATLCSIVHHVFEERVLAERAVTAFAVYEHALAELGVRS